MTPFMAGGVSTLTVESDHDYHPNEDPPPPKAPRRVVEQRPIMAESIELP